MSNEVIVTGGAGFIGSHVCKALARAGYNPIAYDNLVRGHRWAVQWGPLEVGDIADRDRLDAAFRVYRPAAIIHLAAFAYVGESIDDPGKYYRNNVAGTLSLLEAARDHSIQQIVFSSTCATYGVPDVIPIAEDHVQSPINAYGASKLMVERILWDFSFSHGIRSISLRYFNAAGADPSGEIGEAHKPETHLIPLILDAAASDIEVQVFGDDYDTPDGTCIRDYIHVCDLADAHVRALRALERGVETTAYNLANGKGFSVLEVIRASERVTGLPIRRVIRPRRPGDPARLVGDASLAETELGWHPTYQDLHEIIQTVWAWRSKIPE